MSALNKRQNPAKMNTLLTHLQSTFLQKEMMRQFYQKTLTDTQNYRDKLENMEYEMKNNQAQEKPMSEKQIGESSMLMTKSKILKESGKESLTKLNKSRILSKSLINKQPVTFEAQYQICSENLNKLIVNIADREHPQAKNVIKTGSSFHNKSMRASRASNPRRDTLRVNTERSQAPQSKSQKIMGDLGDSSLLAGQDQIINNLLANIKKQEQKYISLVMASTELAVQQKMSNYLTRQCQKYNELMFNLKQQESDKTLSSLKTNKQTIRLGYTDRMKQVVDRGLRSK